MATQNFPDGSSISVVNRDEFLYRRSDGKYVIAYVFLAAPGNEFDRVIVKDSLKKWSSSGMQEDISEDEQKEIIEKLSSFRNFKNMRLGLGETRSRPPIPINGGVRSD